MHARHVPALLALALIGAATPRVAEGQGSEYVREHYFKREYRIPMRDGVRLFTAVYVPKGEGGHRPILLQRTPYSVAPYGEDRFEDDLGPSPRFGGSGYVVAYQDVRGTHMSEGQFVDMRPQVVDRRRPIDIDESTDAFDTIDWLVKNVPGNNGRVGVWGISYPGFYAAAALVDAHPALVAASPQAPLVDWFLGDDVHHNGAFFLQQEFHFDAILGMARPAPTKRSLVPFDFGTEDAYKFYLELGPLPRADELHFRGTRPFWSELMAHGTYDDFWKARALLPHIRRVRPAVLTVGGWYDAEDLYGPLHLHQAIKADRPSGENLLVMGPWVHGGWSRGGGESLGPVSFDAPTAEFFRESIEFPFFEHHLKGVDSWDPPGAWMFETGRNRWHRLPAWPPAEARPRSLYLGAGGSLDFEAPAGPAFDEYVSDPARPVPYTATVSIDPPKDFPVEDQRFAARRPDVLAYQTGPLQEPLTIAGPILAELFASTTGTDSDWVVKLIDVHTDDAPDPEPNPKGLAKGGYQQLVRADVIRGKFRDSMEHPEPFRPGEPTRVAFTLQDAYHTFRPGHRVMVQVQSSWFPLVDRNPQTFTDIYRARPEDFRPATQRVYRSPGRASRIEVKVVP